MGHFRDAEFYNDIYERYDKYHLRWQQSEYRYLWELAYLLYSELGDLPLLEIGCGCGQMGRMFVDRGVQYTGFDYSHIAVQKAKKFQKLKIIQADARESDIYNRNFEVAICLEVLEHTDDLKIIENIGKGKTLIGSVPDFDDRAHIRHFKTREEVEERYEAIVEIEKIMKLDYWHLFRGTIK